MNYACHAEKPVGFKCRGIPLAYPETSGSSEGESHKRSRKSSKFRRVYSSLCDGTCISFPIIMLLNTTSVIMKGC